MTVAFTGVLLGTKMKSKNPPIKKTVLEDQPKEQESSMVRLVDFLANFDEKHDAPINHNSISDNNDRRIIF